MLPDLKSLGLTVTRLRSTDAGTVSELCHGCRDFFELVTGEPVATTTALDVQEQGPPGVDSARKHVLGFWREGRLVGMMDLIEGFPADDEWYVGLLVLLPSERNRGGGRAIWTAVEIRVREAGCSVVRLVVQEQNPRAAHFWTSLGFVKGAQVVQSLGSRTNHCWRFEKRPSPGTAEQAVAGGRGPRLRSEPRR